MTQAPMKSRKEYAKEREDATPPVDELTARGVAREAFPTQAPPADLDGAPGVTEINPGYRRLYKRVDYGWKPTIVSFGSVEACVESGAFRFECGDCGTTDCGLDPNSCKGRAPIKFTRCPVRSCRKPVYDTTEDFEGDAPEADDPNEIKLGDVHSTPESRLRVKMNRHLRFAHLSVAEELGVAQDPFMVPGAHMLANLMQPAVPVPVHPADRPARGA